MNNPEGTSKKSLPRGIPENHPSIGKDVREPVRGPSWPEPKDHGGKRLIGKGLMWMWGVILAAWVVYSRLFYICPNFNDPDAAKFAFGIAERLRGVPYSEGLFYQFSKHVGYYWLMELLAKIFNVEVAGIQHFMASSNAWFMIGILILNVAIAYMIWGGRVALVSSTLLSISPMMWITGEYSNPVVPALFFFMLAVFLMVMSYRVKGGRWWLIASGVMFAWAIMVRVDMVLGMLVPICYALFVDKRGLRRALILYGITALVLIIVWFGILRLSIFEIAHVGPHLPDYPRSLTLNWWGMGPFLFVFAFAGFVYRFIIDRRPIPFIFFWIVAFNTFYTGHVYSGRYFISYYPVVSWLAAFSIIALYGWLAQLVKYNIPMRIVFMLLLALGASTMLTTSIIREGDGRLRVAYGEYKVYQTNHGLEPDGAVWFYMQDLKEGADIQRY
ncbi:MAG: glycosyltransferase family 39 protein [bacterium]|nr:glycosyltransferase family 39 protein [bacterium]